MRLLARNLAAPLVIQLVLAFALTSPAAAAIADRESYEAALRAAGEHLPGIAARKFSALLDKESDLTSEERNDLQRRLLESLVRSGQNDKALELAAVESIRDLPAIRFWKAQALIGAGRLTDAVETLHPLAEDASFELSAEARLGEAGALTSLGEKDRALALLHPLLDAKAGSASGDAPSVSPRIRALARILAVQVELEQEHYEDATALLAGAPADTPDSLKPRLDFLEGLCALRQGDSTKAVEVFRRLSTTDQPVGGGTSLKARAALWLIESLVQSGDRSQAATVLETFIEKQPESPLLTEAFRQARLLELLAAPEMGEALGRWSKDTKYASRQALAELYLALARHAAGETDAALDLLDAWLTGHPDSPFRPLVLVHMAEIATAGSKLDKTREALAELTTLDDEAVTGNFATFARARAEFDSGNYEDAARLFRRASDDATIASFNAALAALPLGDDELFARFSAGVAAEAGSNQLATELALERGLYLASQADASAFDALKKFIAENPNHPRVAEADLALAELYLMQIPAKPITAREHLDAARQRVLSISQQERLDYIAIWIEDRARNDRGVIERSLSFLNHWPQSPLRASVSMKLGEVYFRIHDYANAAIQFERLVENDPESEFAGLALFYSGKAASLTLTPENQQKAIEIWGRLAEKDGPLALEARYQQGSLKLKLEAWDDAIAAFDSILQHEPPPSSELRLATSCDKGQALFAKSLSAGNDPELMQQAIAVFELVISDPEASRAWRNQAGVRKGKCLEKLGKTTAALEAYYDVIEAQESALQPTGVTVEEFDWYYRAGFGALALLRELENYKAAVALADRLARSPGPRAQEAAKLADRLRLEHGIWDASSAPQ